MQISSSFVPKRFPASSARFASPLFLRRNSEEQRKTADGFAVIFAFDRSENQDFRPVRKVAR
jgi:hypothetical protein